MEISAPVTLAVLGAALLHATWNASVKSSEDKGLDTVAIAAGSGLIALVVAPFLPVPASASWPWLAGSAAVHILYFVFLAGAYRWGDLSYSYPIMRGGGPLIVAVAGIFFFREMPSAKESFAIALICAGILAFAHGSHDRRATWFAIGNALVIAAYTIIDAQGARASGAPVAYTAWFFVANGVVITAMGLVQRGAALPAYLQRHWLRAIGGGACAAGAYAIALWAMTRAPVALVATLRETSVIFAAIIAFVVFKEKLTGQRIAATAAVLAGLVALRV
jgi:drug/metabolite transporter (DMT)-like permease